ncbi:unnamed protein product [Rangifer tarandus platyrhynchus]|uniref:Uncharacterized protein n=1 Tax=Rangifer tarandus platyrhynchus TaxID=3082113 RepID=A0AC59YAN5_RANTA
MEVTHTGDCVSTHEAQLRSEAFDKPANPGLGNSHSHGQPPRRSLAERLFFFWLRRALLLPEGVLWLRREGAGLWLWSEGFSPAAASLISAQAPECVGSGSQCTGLAAPRNVGSSQSRDQTRAPCSGGGFSTAGPQGGPALSTLQALSPDGSPRTRRCFWNRGQGCCQHLTVARTALRSPGLPTPNVTGAEGEDPPSRNIEAFARGTRVHSHPPWNKL